MGWVENLNKSVSYIEDNLAGSVDYNEAARIACCSTFQYQRMFSYIAGVTLSEYIRRRRMTLAAFDLQNGSSRIIDIALKYGYESPTSFTRAFRNVHGTSPSLVRKNGVTLKSYSRIFFNMSIKIKLP